MKEDKNIELNETELEAVSGGVRGPGNRQYVFYDAIDRYAVEGYIGRIVYFDGNGHHFKTRVINSCEVDDGCGTRREHKVRVLYDYDKREYKNYEVSIYGSEYQAYRRCRLK